MYMQESDKHHPRKDAAETSMHAHGRLFSDETLASLRELGAILEPIYRRLRAQGRIMKDGTLHKTGDDITEVWKATPQRKS
jgi:hypothetical protein